MQTHWKCFVLVVFMLLETTVPLVSSRADEPSVPAEYTYRVFGLFGPQRDEEFREVLKQFPEIEVVAVDQKSGEATFKYDERKVFGQGTPAQIVERFDSKVRGVTRSTFGVAKRLEKPAEKFELIEIPIVGLDCQACCFAAYKIVYEQAGVKQASASFKDGKVTALIDPEQTNRDVIEAALKQQGVLLTAP